jgi:CheY-like chemotaxis protein
VNDLVISFDAVDDARAAAAIDWIGVLPLLAEGEVRACDLGADPAARRIRVLPLVRGELADRITHRIEFWAARSGGRAEAGAKGDADRRRRELHESEFVVRHGDPLRLISAIRAAFPCAPGSPALPIVSALRPALALEIGGPGFDGVTYDRRTRELHVPSPLAPPVGDRFLLELREQARRRPPARVRVRVVARTTAASATADNPAAFRIRLLSAGSAHDVLAAHCPPPSSLDRRIAQRYRLGGVVNVRPVDGDGGSDDPEQARAAVRDISMSGALIRTPSPCAVGDRLELKGVLPNGGELCAMATVVRTSRESAGVRFEDTSACLADLAAAITHLGGRPRRALVVDDDPLSRAMLADVFASHGYEVMTAPDATRGFHELTDQLFAIDLLVTDLYMAGIDGERLVQVIRELGGENDLPILVVTSASDMTLLSKLRRLGADDVVSKAAGPEVAFARGHALVERRHMVAGALQAGTA